MAKMTFRFRIIAIITSLILTINLTNAQDGFDDATRALFILSILDRALQIPQTLRLE
jgi:hypothetical protein